MPLTDAQTTGLKAAILAYLTAEGGCFARTAAAFKQDVGDDLFVVSDCVLKYVVSRGNKTSVDKKTLEAMVLSYLNSMAEGRFTRTVAAFKEEALIDGDGEVHQVVSETALETAWKSVHDESKSDMVFDAIKKGDLAEVQMYICVGVDVKAMRLKLKEIGDNRDDDGNDNDDDDDNNDNEDDDDNDGNDGDDGDDGDDDGDAYLQMIQMMCRRLRTQTRHPSHDDDDDDEQAGQESAEIRSLRLVLMVTQTW